MEYLLIIVITIANVPYGFVIQNPIWTQQECDEKAEEIELSFVPAGTSTIKAHCVPKIGDR